MCGEVYIILRWKAYKSEKIRLGIYVVAVFFISGLVTLIFYVTGSIGISELQTCLIEVDSVGEKFDVVFSLFLAIVLITSYILVRKQLGCCYGPVFHHLTKLVLNFLIGIVLSRIFLIIIWLKRSHDKEFSNVLILLGSFAAIFSEFVVGLKRLLHPKVIFKIKSLFSSRAQFNTARFTYTPEREEQVLQSILIKSVEDASDDISDMFDHLGHKIIIQILVLLTLKFKSSKEPHLSLKEAINLYRGVSDKFEFTKEMYTSLGIQLNMPHIQMIYCSDVSLLEYEAGIFTVIRKNSEIDSDLLLDSLLTHDNLKSLAELKSNEGGKSNSFFFSSSNDKIVIKTITTEERKVFLKFLPNYAKRVIKHPESKLVRILGLFQILPHNQDFIIMENCVLKRDECLIFDLKGSTVDRHVGGIDSTNPPTGVVLKDLNFKLYSGEIKVPKSRIIKKILKKDMDILRKNKLMDYSMLLTIYPQAPQSRYSISPANSLAIIDFFQKYTVQKSLERFWKKKVLRKSKGISVLSPDRYFNRIKKFLKQIIVDAYFT